MKRIRVLKILMIFWLFIITVLVTNWHDVTTFFLATIPFNSAVVTVMAIGSIYIFRASLELVILSGIFGVLAYKKTDYERYLRTMSKHTPPHIGQMFLKRKSHETLYFTEKESKEVTDWLESKFHQQRQHIMFFTNIPLLIGLFGTFTGLLEAIDDMGKIVMSMVGEIKINDVIQSFAGPLSGMAIGFGASLFAVGVSIMLGLMSYILMKNQDVFVEGVEDWMKDRIVDVNVDEIDNIEDKDALLHKETFLDLFLVQMQGLTNELSNISNGNKALLHMTDKLDEIKQVNEGEALILGKIANLLVEQSQTHHGFYSSTTSSLRTLEDRTHHVINNQELLLKHSEDSFDSMRTLMIDHASIMNEANRLLNQLDQTVQKGQNDMEGLMHNVTSKQDAMNIWSQDVSRFLETFNHQLEKESHTLATLVTQQRSSFELNEQFYQTFDTLLVQINATLVRLKDHSLHSEENTQERFTQLVDAVEKIKNELNKVQHSVQFSSETLKTIEEEKLDALDFTLKQQYQTALEVKDHVKELGDKIGSIAPYTKDTKESFFKRIFG